jgi:hypothetical protein
MAIVPAFNLFGTVFLTLQQLNNVETIFVEVERKLKMLQITTLKWIESP